MSRGGPPPRDLVFLGRFDGRPVCAGPAGASASVSFNATRPNLLVAPGVAWLVAFMVVPCLLVLSYAFFQRGVWGGVEYTFTLENFARVASSIRSMLRSFSIRRASR